MTFLWAFQLSPVPKQASWTLSLLCSSAADCSCISGNAEVYFKNLLLFPALGALCDATVLVRAQGGMKTRTNRVSVWLCVCSGAGGGLSVHCNVYSTVWVCMCKHVHIFASVSVCVCHKCWASVYVYILVKWVCAFMLQARVVLLLSRSIQPASPGCSWDDVIRTFFFCMCGSVSQQINVGLIIPLGQCKVQSPCSNKQPHLTHKHFYAWLITELLPILSTTYDSAYRDISTAIWKGNR